MARTYSVGHIRVFNLAHRFGLALVLALGVPLGAAAQQSSPDPYTPITDAQRGKWIVEGSVGLRSLSVGVFTSSLLTAMNSPNEWHRSWSGFGKRYGNREANVTMSNSIEAGLGALWGEDPRYIRSGRGGVWPRIGRAAKSSVMARGRDGRLRPAWARYAGTVTSNLVANNWLPPSVTSAGDMPWRISLSVLGRLTGNAFEEFWPDVRQRFRK